MRIVNDRYLSFQFVSCFFEDGDLFVIPPENVEEERERRGCKPDDTQIAIRDENSFHTFINYDSGELQEAYTKTNQSETINPQKGFKFWIALSKGPRESPEIPEKIKGNLKRAEHITSLKDYFDGLRSRHGSLDKYFKKDYLNRCYPRFEKIYHPGSLD